MRYLAACTSSAVYEEADFFPLQFLDVTVMNNFQFLVEIVFPSTRNGEENNVPKQTTTPSSATAID